MELVCYRSIELQREPRYLPATTYNTARLLLDHSTEGIVFVPMRNLQYLAVIDDEEIVFLDSANKTWIDIAWQHFRPQQRTALTDPVHYEAVYYRTEAKQIMQRLLSEFPLALKALTEKNMPSSTARIIKLEHKPG